MEVPTPRRPAVNQSNHGYLFPEMALPINMTGMTLQAYKVSLCEPFSLFFKTVQNSLEV